MKRFFPPDFKAPTFFLLLVRKTEGIAFFPQRGKVSFPSKVVE